MEAFEIKINTCEILLFGQKVLLAERSAKDVNTHNEYSKSLDQNFSSAVFLSLITLRDALKINLRITSIWKFKKWMRLKKICDKNYLLQNLTASQLMNLAFKVIELENKNLETLTSKETERKENE